MAAPTYAEAWSKLIAAIKLYDELYDLAMDNSPNLVTLFESYETASKADGPEATTASQSVLTFRQRMDSVLSTSENTMAPLVKVLARSSVINCQSPDINVQLKAIYDYMAANAKRVTTRAFTRGAFASGSPYVGDGSISRVTKDEGNYDLEASQPEVLKLTVDKDQNSGRPKGRETWKIEGYPYVDSLEYYRANRGSAALQFINAVNGADSLLNNASFSSLSGTVTVPTAITNWASSVTVNATNYQFDTTNYYQEDTTENGSPKSLQVNVTATLQQYLQPSTAAGTNVAKSTPIDHTKPYFCSNALNASVGGAVGLLELHMGAVSKSLVVNGAVGAVAAAGAAGSVTAGNHSWYVTFVVSGVESAYGVKSNVLNASGSTVVSLTSIPLGPANTTARKVYRTVTGDTGLPKLLSNGTISNNTATTLTDADTDAALGAAVGTASHTGWVQHTLPTTNQSDLWFKNWNETDADIKIVWTRTAGNLLLDRVMFLPYVPILNRRGKPSTFILPVSGATPWKRLDTGTITDTETGAVIQQWMERSFGFYFPHASGGSITEIDP